MRKYGLRYKAKPSVPSGTIAPHGDYRPHLEAIRALVSPLQWETICEVFREQDAIIRAGSRSRE